MKGSYFKNSIPHIIAIGIFLALSFAYFHPAFTGKTIQQGDIVQFSGMSKEIVDYREKTGEEPLWTNSMFGGMPAYQISVLYKGNLITHAYQVLSLGLPNLVNYVFLCMLGFYFLLIVLRIDPWLAVGGAVAFAFSSYFFQALEAGHNSKLHAIAYMAPILASIILIFRRKYLLGGTLLALFFAMQLRANHLQITYYMGFILFFYFVLQLYLQLKEKSLPHYFKSAGIAVAAVALAIMINIGNIWGTYEYMKHTIRGKSELTTGGKDQKTGLDLDYITNWSYGVGETWNLMIPNFKGGSSSIPIGANKEAMQKVNPQLRQVVGSMPQYFGDMPFTSGPSYLGAVVVFLFLLALFFYKGPFKWFVVVCVCIAIPLSWGKNFMGMTEFFVNYMPFYSKFRTVPMIQVIVQLLVPLFGILSLDRLLREGPQALNKEKKKFFLAAGIPIVILLAFYLMPASFNDFFGDAEYSRLRQQLLANNWPEMQMNQLFDEIEVARIEIFKADVLRSLIFVVLTAVVIWLFAMQKLNRTVLIVSVSLLALIDLWAVNKRYLNEDSFVAIRKMETPYSPTAADQQILQDPDPHFRVMNLTTSTFNDGRTSYYHKSIGGYHAAKLMRYQELIDYHISRNNMDVLNMLNAKYFIVAGEGGQPVARKNPEALGNAWFVEDYLVVEDAEAEINALSDFDPSQTAIIDQRFGEEVAGLDPGRSEASKITLVSYAPNELKYHSASDQENLAVFSEIYYEDGWNAYIDGQAVPHFRVNYALRGLRVPAGEHEIVFRFEPVFYTRATTISGISSIILLCLLGFTLYKAVRNKKSEAVQAHD